MLANWQLRLILWRRSPASLSLSCWLLCWDTVGQIFKLCTSFAGNDNVLHVCTVAKAWQTVYQRLRTVRRQWGAVAARLICQHCLPIGVIVSQSLDIHSWARQNAAIWLIQRTQRNSLSTHQFLHYLHMQKSTVVYTIYTYICLSNDYLRKLFASAPKAASMCVCVCMWVCTGICQYVCNNIQIAKIHYDRKYYFNCQHGKSVSEFALE